MRTRSVPSGFAFALSKPTWKGPLRARSPEAGWTRSLAFPMRRAKTLLERLSGRQVVDASPALEMLVLDVSAIGPQRPAGERPRIALERPMGNRMERSGPTPGSCPPAGVFPDDAGSSHGKPDGTPCPLTDGRGSGRAFQDASGNTSRRSFASRPVLAFDPAVISVADPLTAALDELKLRCVPLFDGDAALRWRRVFPERVVSIHAVVEGTCLIDTDTLLWRELLDQGDVLVLDGTHRGELRAMTEGIVPEVASARIELQSPLAHPMLAALPPLMQLGSSSMPSSFARCVHSLREELASERLGRGTIVGQLCATLFVLALRSHIDGSDSSRRDWFRMLSDPLLREPLALASNPGISVAALAAAAGRSRQRTRARFTRLGGVPPSLLLRRARVRRAVELLGAGVADLTRVATKSGFGSRQSLCRAFRRELGVSPATHWRATHRRPFPRSDP